MDENPFLETSVARLIFHMIDEALRYMWNAAIYGEPGVGKTRALEAYVAGKRYASMMTATAVTGNALRDLLREIANTLNIHVSGSIADVQKQISRYDLSGHVLIIDEAQNLKLQAFRELLHLHDFSGLTIIFCGNKEVLKRVNTDTGAFAQISGRVPFRETVDGILDEDADAIAHQFGVTSGDPIRLVRTIGAHFHARGIVRVLQVAHERAASKAIRIEHIRDAIELFPQYRMAITAKVVRSAVA